MNFSWGTQYTDDSWFYQHKPDGTENKYIDIDRTRIKRFALFDEQGKGHVVLNLRPNQKLIYRRRGFITIGSEGRVDETVWLLGWQENRNGVNVQAILFVFEDGHIEFMDRFREDYAPFCAPVLRSEET